MQNKKPSYNTANKETYADLRQLQQELRASMTPAERILWTKLRGKKVGGLKFRRQHIVGSYIPDFVCLESKLIIEVDGGIHLRAENKKRDKMRDSELNRLGYYVLRFTNQEVEHHLSDVIKSIQQTLADLDAGLISPFEGL